MYIEFFFIIYDYFKTLTKRVAVFEWGVPCVFCIAILLNSLVLDANVELFGLISSSINVIGVLLGFTLAAMTIIISNGNTQIDATKVFKTNYKISGKKITLNRLIIINFSYLIFIESGLCISFLLGSLFSNVMPSFMALYVNCIYFFFVFQVFLLTTRSITDLYLILSKEK